MKGRAGAPFRLYRVGGGKWGSQGSRAEEVSWRGVPERHKETVLAAGWLPSTPAAVSSRATMVLSAFASSPSAELVAKAEEIHRVLSAPKVDVWKLRELALTEGGLVDDAIRKKAWPILVGIDDVSAVSNKSRQRPRGRPATTTGARRPAPPGVPPPGSHASALPPRPPSAPAHEEQAADDFTVVSNDPSLASTASQITAVTSHTTPAPPKCLDAAQVARDVARCTWHLLTGSQRAQRLQMEYKRNKKVARHIQRKQDKLGGLICDTLVASYDTQNPLRYYQGYHDVACIVLSTLQDTHLASRVLLQISYSHLRDCCNPDFESLQEAIQLSVLPMLQALDPPLYHKLQLVDMTPYFCLSWILTWFAHDVRDTALVKRLFDAFLASHAMLPSYVAVAMLICNRREILDCENDFSQLHQCLCGLPKNSSRVGWKYRPGEGYVTDEEHGGTTVSTTSSIGTADFLLVAAAEEAEQHVDSSGAVAPTTLLSSISSIEAPSVSFDELIMEAIEIMRDIPPSRIVRIRQCATKQRTSYSTWFSCRGMAASSAVHPLNAAPLKLPRMLQEPPFWAVRGFVERSKNSSGSSALGASSASSAGSVASSSSSRRRRHGANKRRYNHRSRSRSSSVTGRTAIVTDEERLEVQDYLQNHSNNLAVIAAGYGAGRSARAGKRVLGTGTAVAAAAAVVVAVGVAAYYHRHNYTIVPHDREPPRIGEPEIVLAVSSLVDSIEGGNDTSLSETWDMGQCMITWSPADRAMDDLESVPSQQPAPEVSSPVLTISLLAPMSPHDYYLADLCHYQILVAAAQRVLARELAHVQKAVVLSAVMAKPAVLRATRFMEMQLAHLESSPRGRQVLASFRRAARLLEQGRTSVAAQLRSVAPRMDRSAKVLEGAVVAQLHRACQLLAKAGPMSTDNPLGQAFRVVAAHPVAQKVVETSVALLLEASFTNLYG